MANGGADYPYAEKYHFFDDDYARKHKKFISNSIVRKKLHKASVIGKLVFDYKMNYGKNYPRRAEAVDFGFVSFEFYDFFVLVNLLTKVSKSIELLNKTNNLIRYFDDVKILESYLYELSADIKKIIESYKNYKYSNHNALASMHPYVSAVNLYAVSDLPKILRSKAHREAENFFVRTANQNRKKINEFIKSKFIGSKTIFICRLDIFLRNNELNFSQNFSLKEYRKYIDIFLDKLSQFNDALDVVFPSALLSGGVIPSNLPVGQIVLISTERVGANKKDLQAFASQVSCSGPLEFVPAKPFPNDLSPSVDGVLQFTPSTVEAINWLAEFLTIERRFVAPGEGSTDGVGTAHCYRFIELNY